MGGCRVLIPVANPVGGIRTYLIYNLKRLHEAGYRFTFLAPAGEGFETLKKDTVSWEGTEYIDIPGGKKEGLSAIRHTLRTQQFDLIHSQGIHFGTLVSLVNYFRQTPHLITLHNVVVPDQNLFGRFASLKKRLAAFVTRRASCIIPVSCDCEANYLETFPAWKKGPVHVTAIRHGIDVSLLEHSREQFEIDRQPNLREQFGIGNNVLLGGFFGRFMPEKGFDIVLKALALLAERGYRDRFHVVATVDANGYRQETLRDTAANSDVSKMVHFLPAVPIIAPLLLQTDVLIMPSRWEACGLLAMESLVLGTPVIGSDCLGLREVLSGTPAVVVPRDDPEALADAVASFVDNPQPAKDAAKNYFADAGKRFDVNIAVEQLLGLYQSFTANKTLRKPGALVKEI